MIKDAKTYAVNGGWGFQVWGGGDPTETARPNCRCSHGSLLRLPHAAKSPGLHLLNLHSLKISRFTLLCSIYDAQPIGSECSLRIRLQKRRASSGPTSAVMLMSIPCLTPPPVGEERYPCSVTTIRSTRSGVVPLWYLRRSAAILLKYLPSIVPPPTSMP